MAAGSSVTVAGALSSRAKSIKSKESPDRIVTVYCHRAVGLCTCMLRIHTPGLLANRHHGKTA